MPTTPRQRRRVLMTSRASHSVSDHHSFKPPFYENLYHNRIADVILAYTRPHNGCPSPACHGSISPPPKPNPSLDNTHHALNRQREPKGAPRSALVVFPRGTMIPNGDGRAGNEWKVHWLLPSSLFLMLTMYFCTNLVITGSKWAEMSLLTIGLLGVQIPHQEPRFGC